MSDIVIELQKELIDKSKKLSDILPKAYLIARNLSLNELANWLKLEMNGYNDENMKELPKYRIIKGDIKAHNPYRGWVPVAFVNSQELENLATNSKCSQSISELENILEKCKNDHDIYISVPGLSKYMNHPMPCAIFCGSSPIIGIINNVRNELLEWTIKLKEKCIRGENMEFLKEDVKKAKDTAPTSITYNIREVHGGMQTAHNNDTVNQTQNNRPESLFSKIWYWIKLIFSNRQ